MRTTILFLLAGLLPAADLRAQGFFEDPERPDARTFYLTNGSEWMFTFPVLRITSDSVPPDQGGIVRFAPLLNPKVFIQWDLGAHVGFFSGIGIRNLGFIYDVPRSNERFKYRAYTVGVPLGIKLGRMHEALVFAGCEVEVPFNYKEKRFANERKEDKFNVWFSNRTAPYFQNFMLGVQTGFALDIVLRYYVTNFHNTAYREVVDGVERRPYEGLNANLFCVSVGWGMHAGRKRKRTYPAPVVMPEACIH